MSTVLYLAVNASYSHTSLAGGYLGAVATAAGWRWMSLETLNDADLAGVLGRMQALRPQVLAVTLYLFNCRHAMRLVRRYKALDPDCRVIAGGPEFDGDNRAFLMREPSVDAVFRGEGEIVFGQWLADVNRPDHWSAIAGCCFVDRISGDYHDGGWAEAPDRLDALPDPYDDMPELSAKPFVQMETSRGCSNRCSFCRGNGPKGLRQAGMTRVRRQLTRLRQAGVREIRVLDRTFNEPAGRAQRLLAMMIDDFSELRFHLEIDPGRLTPALIDTLTRARVGQLHLEAGIQTLSPEAWRLIGRRGSPACALDGLQTLTGLPNVSVHADLIAGLPGSSAATLRDDVRTLIMTGPAELQLETLKGLPGTPIRAQASALGLVFAPDTPYEVLQTPMMTVAEMTAAAALSRAIDWFYNPPALQATVRRATAHCGDLWDRLIDVVCRHGGGTAGKPGLRNRFVWLAEILATQPDLIHALQYAWMLQGLGERAGFIVPRPWRTPIPADAVCVSDQSPQPTATASGGGTRRWVVRLERPYLFEYHTDAVGRRRTVVYRLV